MKKKSDKKVYISGQMTGLENFQFSKFNQVASLLRESGYNVINPAEFGVKENWQWKDYMKKDISELIYCDYVAVLEGWEKSRGACLEVYIAQQLEIPVLNYKEFIK